MPGHRKNQFLRLAVQLVEHPTNLLKKLLLHAVRQTSLKKYLPLAEQLTKQKKLLLQPAVPPAVLPTTNNRCQQILCIKGSSLNIDS